MTAYNKTIIIGRLGANPELKQRGKTDYVKFPICNSTIRDGKEDIQWHNIVVFGKQAIVCHDNLNRGDLCCIEGRIDERMIGHCKPGQFPTIIAERITFLSSRKHKEADNECAISANGQ